MNFAERNGFNKSKEIQINGIDENLRNRLYNIYNKYLNYSTSKDSAEEYICDRLGYSIVEENSEENIKNTFYCDSNCWYSPYDIIEYLLLYKNTQCEEEKKRTQGYYNCNNCGDACYIFNWKNSIINQINDLLEEEKSGYRLVNNQFVPITNEQELNSITEACNTPFMPVNTHLNKALSLYSDRKLPDYENSIKESISAVESICCIISGEGSTTLGKALKKLEDSGVNIHPALKNAFEKLFGYTSDSNGIRHGGDDFKNAPAEDAKFMLVSCSAFVNYLIEKKQKYVDKNELKT